MWRGVLPGWGWSERGNLHNCLLLTMACWRPSPATARPSHDQPIYKDPNAPVEQRVEDLLSRMTLEEKIAQITCIWNRKQEILTPSGDFDAAKAKQVFPAGIGQVARPSDIHGSGNPYEQPFRNARETITLVNAIQHYAMKDTRLGIPVLFHEEGLHGYVARDATSFPQAIALASSWDPDLLTRVFTVAAREMRARGAQLALAPVVDVGSRSSLGPNRGNIRRRPLSRRDNSASPRCAASRGTPSPWHPAEYSPPSNT